MNALNAFNDLVSVLMHASVLSSSANIKRSSYNFRIINNSKFVNTLLITVSYTLLIEFYIFFMMEVGNGSITI